MKYNILQATKTDYVDMHGNVSYSLLIQDEAKQTYSALLTQKPTSPFPEGEIYGTIEEKTSKVGKPYYKFFKDALVTPYNAPQSTNKTEPDWDAIAEGKVRHGVVCALIQAGKTLDEILIECPKYTELIIKGEYDNTLAQELEE